MTPAEAELLKVISANLKDGEVKNVRQLSIKSNIDYYHALRYKKRLEDKGLITSHRCGAGRYCPVTISKNEKVEA